MKQKVSHNDRPVPTTTEQTQQPRGEVVFSSQASIASIAGVASILPVIINNNQFQFCPISDFMNLWTFISIYIIESSALPSQRSTTDHRH